jgi:hypothetical protein
MNMMAFQQDKEVLSKEFLQSLNNGLEVIRFEVSYPQVEGMVRIMFTMWVMLTIASRCHTTGYTKASIDDLSGVQDFIYGLGCSQLHAFFELEGVHR